MLSLLLPALLATSSPEAPEPPVAPRVELPPAAAVPSEAAPLAPLPAPALLPRAAADAGAAPAVAPVAPVAAPAGSAPAAVHAERAPSPGAAPPGKRPLAQGKPSRKGAKEPPAAAAAVPGTPAVPPTPEELGAPTVPPSLSSKAFLDEVRQTAVEQRSSRQRREDDRARLERLAKEIAEARAALRQETERLEVAKKASEQRRPPPAPAPADGSAARPATEAGPYGALAKTVKGMRPEKAAEIVAHLDRALAVELLRRIRPGDAAVILEKLRPETAAELVGRMASAGTEAP